jgi:dTDP-4-dehydrorhamnose 3,5-epimerase
VRIEPTGVAGVFTVEPEPHYDERGFFADAWNGLDFARAGLRVTFERSSISYNAKTGTLRGLHYQVAPHAEAKLVRCTRGEIFDVAVDLRPDSPTFKRWTSSVLTAENHRALFVPEGCAHGFQSLADESEVLYFLSRRYVPDAARAIAWNDPSIGIEWPPATHRIMSLKDAGAKPYAG